MGPEGPTRCLRGAGTGYSSCMSLEPLARDPDGPRLRIVPSRRATHPMVDDEDLVRAFEQGRADAGGQLYDRLFPVVDSTLTRILGRREQDHPDLVQSVFEQVVSSLSKRTYARGCSLARWAAVIACHVGLNALRSRRRERAVLDREQVLDERGVSAQSIHLEGQLGARAELEAVRHHLADMDAARVTAMLLHAMGCDLAEIAQLTGTSVAAAQSRLSRGRRELRTRMEQSAPGEPPSPRIKRIP
jgi:RNA polymerase sigma-70 factor (ECF subfamily)